MAIGHKINKEPLRIKKFISCLSIQMFSIFVSRSVYEVANSREILLMVMYFFCIYRELHCPYEPLNQRMYEAVLNVIGAYFIRKKASI